MNARAKARTTAINIRNSGDPFFSGSSFIVPIIVSDIMKYLKI
jgi:hypothetical protein